MQLNRTTVLAQQSAGAALGNMAYIHNIVAVCTVLDLRNREGFILLRTAGLMLIYTVIVDFVGLIL